MHDNGIFRFGAGFPLGHGSFVTTETRAMFTDARRREGQGSDKILSSREKAEATEASGALFVRDE